MATRTLEDSREIGDGRRLRRDRNRDAVVDALLALHREGNLAPTGDEITARAGLSPRSLFRYFDDLDDLARTAIDRAQAGVEPLLAIDAAPDDPFARRTAAVAAQRAALFEDVASIAQVTRLRAPFQPVVAQRLARARAHLRDQLRELFAAELDAMRPELATRRLAVADVVTSFESYRLLRDDQGLSRSGATAAMADALARVLDPGGNP